MPPRKRAKKEDDSESDEASDYVASDSPSEDPASESEDYSDASDESPKAKKKKPAAAAAKKKAATAPKAAATPKAAPKAKAAAAAAPAAAEGEGEGASPAKRKRTPAKKKEFVAEEGDPWSYEQGSLIYRDFGTEPNSKIAAFDLDGTLVNTKSGAQFPRGAEDWKFFNKKVPAKVQALAAEGYKIVILSNQGGIKSALGGKMAANTKGRVEAMLEQLDVPAQVFMATQSNQFRKPEAGMWEFMTERCNGGVAPDLSKCFYCGDAAGRQGEGASDFSDSDKKFAENLGLPFKTPEEVFGGMDGKKDVDQAARAAGAEAVKSGTSINQALVEGMKDYADRCFQMMRDTGVEKLKFKGATMQKAAAAIAALPNEITLANYKTIGAIKGIGKVTVEKVKEFLETGAIDLQPPEEAGGGGAPAGPSKRQEAAMAFL